MLLGRVTEMHRYGKVQNRGEAKCQETDEHLTDRKGCGLAP